MNKEEFINELEDLNIKVDEEKLKKLDKYYEMLINYNEHTNLTRITEEKEVYLKHFYDSLTLAKAIDLNNQSLIDVGTGAGFPGLVLKIFFPELKITLIDSLNKRIKFLNQVKNELNLENINIYHARAEEFILNNRENYDIVTSRAVASLNILSELCIPYVKKGGYFIPMKADSKEEIILSKNSIDLLGGKLEDVIEFKLQANNYDRSLIKIKKVSSTPSKYPRKYSEIKKKPL